MPTTYEAIATVTVGSGGAASATFNSIPASFTDLLVKASMRSTTNDNSLSLQFNSTGVNTSRKIEGDGSTATSGTRSDFYLTGVVNPNSSTSNTFSNFELYIPNYAGSSNKSFSVDAVTENNATLAYTNLIAGIWNTTSAITSIIITNALAQYSTFTLYGIKNS